MPSLRPLVAFAPLCLVLALTPGCGTTDDDDSSSPSPSDGTPTAAPGTPTAQDGTPTQPMETGTAAPGTPTAPSSTPTAEPATPTIEPATPTVTPGTPTATPPPPTPTAEPTPTATLPSICEAAEDCDALVCTGEDDQTAIQQALIDASAGDVICLGAGRFHLYNELSLSVNDVTLRGDGAGRTVLDFTEQIIGGNGIHVTSDGATIEALTVVNTPGDGIRASDVEGITFTEVSVIWTDDESPGNGAYGLYPVGSQYVLIQQSEVKGARDAGVYVGQSRYIIVDGNEAWGNVAGIEIENSTDAEVLNNWAHHNTGGILVFNLPELPVKDGKRAKVHDNLVESNNTPNFAPPGNIVGIVPQGTGLLILATDDNEFHDNVIRDNMSAGLALFSYNELLVGESWDDPEFDPYPERNFIHDNVLSNNGYDPQDVAADLLAALNLVAQDPVEVPLPALLWDGCTKDDAPTEGDIGVLNCFDGNGTSMTAEGVIEGEATYGDFKMCARVPFRNYTTDISEVTCVYTPLEGQQW